MLLFCDSTFLTLHNEADPALDYNGQEIRDAQNDLVPIGNVPAYRKALTKNPSAKPWWTGDLTNHNLYVFEEEGSTFCSAENLGTTGQQKTLRRSDAGVAIDGEEYTFVVICPSAFSDTDRPASYYEANGRIMENTNLATVVPRSATLLHEAFHAVQVGDFASGPAEDCE